jgi:hypothetical protein
MFKSIVRLLFIAVLSGNLVACSKSSESLEPETTAPGQTELKGRITTATLSADFGVTGSQVNATTGISGGFKTHQIMGTLPTAPKILLSIILTDVKSPGTYTNRKNAVVKVGLDANNSNTTNLFSSELDVSVVVTKITDREIEGTFSGKLINIEGTHTGYVKDGSFKAKLK